MNITLKARHFKETNFNKCGECAIAKALREAMPDSVVSENVNYCIVDGITYSHRYYGLLEFRIDKRKAEALNYDETPITSMELLTLMKPKHRIAGIPRPKAKAA